MILALGTALGAVPVRYEPFKFRLEHVGAGASVADGELAVMERHGYKAAKRKWPPCARTRPDRVPGGTSRGSLWVSALPVRR